MQSRCCKASVSTLSGHCEAYYVCKKCRKACESQLSPAMHEEEIEDVVAVAMAVENLLDCASDAGMDSYDGD